MRNWALAAVFGLIGCADGDPVDGPGGSGAGGKADDAVGIDELFAVSMSSVEALEGSYESIDPPVEQFVVGDPLTPETYLRPMSALGYFGALGPYGPLGVLGPVGDSSWNVSTLLRFAGPWDVFARMLTDLGGPLSADGPLGSSGPLGDVYWALLREDFPALRNDFFNQLEPGGVFVPLGRIGPLGALGPLGPLGPNGAHGYGRDDVGNYLPSEGECHGSDEVDVCRTFDVPWEDGGEVRTYELYEMYEEDHAKSMTDNDTSFMVMGHADEPEELDSYEFTSSSTQFVTVHLMGQWSKYPFPTGMALLGSSSLVGFSIPFIVPGFFPPFNIYSHESSWDDFDLRVEVVVDDEVVGVTSQSSMFPDWASVLVPAGATVRAHVKFFRPWSAPWRGAGPDYRLFVVGSGDTFTAPASTGAQITPLTAPEG